MNAQICPIWRTPADFKPTSRDGMHLVSARSGGEYFISRTAVVLLDQVSLEKRAALTLWLCNQRKLGVSCPEISSTTLEAISTYPKLRIIEQCERVIDWLYRQIPRIGGIERFVLQQVLHYQGTDTWSGNREFQQLCAHCGALDFDEAGQLLNFCHSAGWITNEIAPMAGIGTIQRNCGLTLDGIIAAESRMNAEIVYEQGFIAMWFSHTMDQVYEDGIGPAVKDAGYVPIRIDQKQHNNKIDDEIVAEIRRSRFVVADFTSELVERQKPDGQKYFDTHARGGVYFEAGFAKGLGKEVIWTVREDVLPFVHFDTRQFAHIVWKDAADLRNQLSVRISATLGDGPLKVTN